jgi:hypothetical protein
MNKKFTELQKKLLAVINEDAELNNNYQNVQRILIDHINYYFDNYLNFGIAVDENVPLQIWTKDLKKQCYKDLELVQERLDLCRNIEDSNLLLQIMQNIERNKCNIN